MTPIQRRAALLAGAVAAAGLSLLSLLSLPSHAADHADCPATTDDHPADITDVYAWHDQDSVTVVLAFAGLTEVGMPADYDASVLYTIHVDNDADAQADFEVLVRFGQSSAGEWGVQVEGLPGIAEPIVGPVETVIDAGLGLRVFAGLRDDPFFFDFDGFRQSLDEGALHFDSDRDSFAATNVAAVVVEMSRDAVTGDAGRLAIWATTGRK
ncbi:MAG: DUF4331 family protein [Deltaproteobacteria bacterium]|nr:DUF4331 family protein [Nannocystaceae bacterium]